MGSTAGTAGAGSGTRRVGPDARVRVISATWWCPKLLSNKAQDNRTAVQNANIEHGQHNAVLGADELAHHMSVGVAVWRASSPRTTQQGQAYTNIACTSHAPIAQAFARPRMRCRGLGAWIVFLQVLLQPICAHTAGAPDGTVTCHHECVQYGNCGDDGMCRCPLGRLGDGCEIDFLAPCKQRPDGIPSCGMHVTKSCECLRRCRSYHCRNDSTGHSHCETGGNTDRGCYFSLVPEANETGVKYFEGYADDAKEIPRDEALFDKWSKAVTAPLSQCSNSCSGKGYCSSWDKQTYFCRCYRGYAGSMCELEAPSCILNCSGRGTCIDHFCHCKPPYFSIGCSRSKVYPKNHFKPNPAAFKIYMYELNTQLAYENARFVGWLDHNEIYIAYQKVRCAVLPSPGFNSKASSSVRAHLLQRIAAASAVHGQVLGELSPHRRPFRGFLVLYPGIYVLLFREHAHLLLDHVRTNWPYWNRTSGRDHFIWTPADRGACGMNASLSQLIRVTHFGMHFTPNNFDSHFGRQFGHPDYGCHHPLKDVVALAYDPRMISFLADSSLLNKTLDEQLQAKKRLFFFAGDVRPHDLSYGGSTRVLLEALINEWKDEDLSWTQGGVPNYLLAFQETKFCLAPYGHGFGMRLQQSILGGCVPVIIQEHVFQPYEDLLPYETFSLRLSNADLPKLREILRGVSNAHYKQLLAGVFRFRHAFHWDEDRGSQAFDYTIASLRRRRLNLQGSLRGDQRRGRKFDFCRAAANFAGSSLSPITRLMGSTAGTAGGRERNTKGRAPCRLTFSHSSGAQARTGKSNTVTGAHDRPGQASRTHRGQPETISPTGSAPTQQSERKADCVEAGTKQAAHRSEIDIEWRHAHKPQAAPPLSAYLTSSLRGPASPWSAQRKTRLEQQEQHQDEDVEVHDGVEEDAGVDAVEVHVGADDELDRRRGGGPNRDTGTQGDRCGDQALEQPCSEGIAQQCSSRLAVFALVAAVVLALVVPYCRHCGCPALAHSLPELAAKAAAASYSELRVRALAATDAVQAHWRSVLNQRAGSQAGSHCHFNAAAVLRAIMGSKMEGAQAAAAAILSSSGTNPPDKATVMLLVCQIHADCYLAVEAVNAALVDQRCMLHLQGQHFGTDKGALQQKVANHLKAVPKGMVFLSHMTQLSPVLLPVLINGMSEHGSFQQDGATFILTSVMPAELFESMNDEMAFNQNIKSQLVMDLKQRAAAIDMEAVDVQAKALRRRIDVVLPIQTKDVMCQVPALQKLMSEQGFDGSPGKFGTVDTDTWSFQMQLRVLHLSGRLAEMLLQSERRTLDPSEADYFYVPVYSRCLIYPVAFATDFPYFHGGPAASRIGAATNLLLEVFHWIPSHHPWWDRSGGRDHIILSVHDEGSCWIPAALRPAIILSHWGRTDFPYISQTSFGPDNYSLNITHPVWQPEGHLGKLSAFPCYDPRKDLTVPLTWSPNKYGSSPLLGAPTRERHILAFFKGQVMEDKPAYSRGTSRFLAKMTRDNNWWGKHRIHVDDAMPKGNISESTSYSEALASSSFCFSLMGEGWGSRFDEAVLHGVRIAHKDMDRVPKILRDFSEAEIARVQANVARVWRRHIWTGYRPYNKIIRQLLTERSNGSRTALVPSRSKQPADYNPAQDDALDTLIQWGSRSPAVLEVLVQRPALPSACHRRRRRRAAHVLAMAPAERFRVRLLTDDGNAEDVTVEVGMEGFTVWDASSARSLRKYPLHHISRWSMRGSSLVLFTRSPSDVEDRSMQIAGDETTIRSVLDTLTSSCMQMAELLQSGHGHDSGGQVAANSLTALLRKSKKPSLLTADQVEFWHHPEKAGWMHSQGEHIKTWRKRWFVLKQGFLFRFAAREVVPASKARGIVDLSTVTDVSDAGSTTGRPNSIKLSTATGHICYLCENETSQVEWFSALEGAVAKIVKQVAGVDEAEEDNIGVSNKAKSWAEQLEKTYASAGSASGFRRTGGSVSGGHDKPGTSSNSGRPKMVSIVNYDTAGSATGRAADSYVTVEYGSSSIAGANPVPHANEHGAAYGNSYPGASEVGGYGGGHAAYIQQQTAYPAFQQQQLPTTLPVHGQQPASGYGSSTLMDSITSPQIPQQTQIGSAWKVHYTAEGRPYFYNATTAAASAHVALSWRSLA
ncbi:putative glycosyltransferase [Chlorella vulgaris]